MSVFSVSEIRQRFATAILTLDGWTESRHAPDRFMQDSQAHQHLGFAVLPAETIPQDPRQRRTAGAYARTDVTVMWTYRLRSDAVVADMDASLDAEGALVQAILGVIDRASISSIIVDRLSRDTTSEGAWMVGTARFQVSHRLQLIPS